VKRVLGYMLLSFGVVLLFIAPMLEFYALPRVEKAPLDVNDRVVSNGIGKYFSPSALRFVGPTHLQNIQIAKGDPQASTHTVAVIHISSHTVDLDANQSVSFDQQTFAFNRRTGYAVNCCGASPPASGVTLKFPFNVDKDTTYQFWDTTADAAFPAKYVRDDVVESVKVWVFVSDVPPTKIGTLDFPGSLVGAPSGSGLVPVDHMYQARTTLWVEPYTGAIVKGGQHALQWAQGPNGEQALADVVFVQDPATVKSIAERISSKRLQLELVKFWVPVIGPIIGAVFVLAGLVILLRRSRRSEPAAAPATRVPAS